MSRHFTAPQYQQLTSGFFHYSAHACLTWLCLAAPIAMSTDKDAEPETLADVVVTSTKIEIPAQYSTQSVTVITEEQIKERNFTDTTQILRQLGNVQFKAASSPGQLIHPKARGLPSAYFLVLVDGVKVNEGLSSGAGNFLGQINPKIIERIEILRGAEADLYGADGVAGVIAITTKGSVLGRQRELATEYGSLQWKQGYGSMRGQHEELGYALNMAYIDSDGLYKHETYRNFTPQLKVDYKQGDWLKVEGSILHMDTTFNYAEMRESYSTDSPETPWWGFQLSDPNQYNQNQQTIGSLNVKHQINTSWRQQALIGWNKQKNSNRDIDDGLLGWIAAPTDNFTLDWVNFYERGEQVPVYDLGAAPYFFENKNLQFDYNLLWESTLAGGKNTALFGYEYQKLEGEKWGYYGEMSAENHSNSFYVNDVLALMDEALVFRAGLRHNDDATYGGKTTGKIGASYTFKDTATTLYSNYGTSFKAPSFNQSLEPQFGNPNVKPEEGRTVEAGVRQDLLGKTMNVEATYWRTKLDDMIAFVGQVNPDGSYSGTFINRDTGQSQGVELTGNYWLNEHWSLNANYTYTDSWSEEHGQRLRAEQIADHTANFGIIYQQEQFSLGANIYYTGPRLRWAGDKETSSFNTTSVFGRAKINKEFSLYGRIDNLFDQDNTEEIGNKQRGMYAIGGIEWKL